MRTMTTRETAVRLPYVGSERYGDSMWWPLVLLAALQMPRMHRPPPPGMYTLPQLSGLRVRVLSSKSALVSWPEGTSAVHYEDERGVVFDEPLASYARRAGVVVSSVDFDASSDTLKVVFDGRLCFSVGLQRVDG